MTDSLGRSALIEIAPTLAPFTTHWPSAVGETAACHGFQTLEPLSIWHETIGKARRAKPIYVRVRDADGGLIMLLPLVFERRRGAQVLTFPDGGVVDYNAPILFERSQTLEPEDMRILWARLLRMLPACDAVALEKMPEHVAGIFNPLTYLCDDPGADAAQCLSLDKDWTAYSTTRLHRPKDSRRKRRRLAESGALTFRIAATPTERSSMLKEMMQQKTQRFLEKNGVDAFDRPGYRRYFPEMTEQLQASGIVHLSGLEVGGELVATHWGLLCGKHFYCVMLTYKLCDHARYSPARLLMEDLIAWCYAKGVHAFDLGAGQTLWKGHLGARAEPLYSMMQARSAFGWAYLQAAQWRRHRHQRAQLSAALIET